MNPEDKIKRLQKEAKYYKDLYEQTHKDYQKLALTHPLKSALCIATNRIVTNIDSIKAITYTDTFGVSNEILKENEELNLVIYKNIPPKAFNPNHKDNK